MQPSAAPARIAALRRGRIVRCDVPSEIRGAPASTPARQVTVRSGRCGTEVLCDRHPDAEASGPEEIASPCTHRIGNQSGRSGVAALVRSPSRFSLLRPATPSTAPPGSRSPPRKAGHLAQQPGCIAPPRRQHARTFVARLVALTHRGSSRGISETDKHLGAQFYNTLQRLFYSRWGRHHPIPGLWPACLLLSARQRRRPVVLRIGCLAAVPSPTAARRSCPAPAGARGTLPRDLASPLLVPRRPLQSSRRRPR